MPRFLFLLFFTLIPLSASSSTQVSICFNYACLTQEVVTYTDEQLAKLNEIFASVNNAETERDAISQAIGLLLGWAGKQTAIHADKGGNLADEVVYGKMDCIDHSTTSTRLLKMLESLGLIKHHHILEPTQRGYLGIFMIHYSAQIEQIATQQENDKETVGTRYAVDTWFYDNGHPAVIIPLERWLSGETPNDAQ